MQWSLQQLPVRLAYAITIHKCQGMTLNKASLSLSSAFEFGKTCSAQLVLSHAVHYSRSFTESCLRNWATYSIGQAYVALSRVQSLEGLRVLDFNPGAVKAHPKVLKFYQELQQRDLEAQRASGQRKNPLMLEDE